MKKKGLLIIAAAITVLSVNSYAEEQSSEIKEYTDTDGKVYEYTVETDGDVKFFEVVTPTSDPSLVKEYTDTDGSVYKYKIINEGTAVKIDGHGVLNSTEITLPETIEGLPVEIVGGAVIKNTDVTSLTLPDSCKKTYGYGGNTKIETIVLNDGIEQIELAAFQNCTSLKNINIPSSITEIEKETFTGCTSLKSIEIPSSVIIIRDMAFSNCSALTNIKFNDGLLRICTAAFIRCDLRNVELPKTLQKIENNAFIDNKNLKEITFPASLETIGVDAFVRSGLEKVEFTGNINQIEVGALNCDNLKEIKGLTDDQVATFWRAFNKTPWAENLANEEDPFIINSKNMLAAYVGTEDDPVIPDGVVTIGEGAFSGKSIKSVTIPSSVTKIDRIAFYQCDNLESITIPASVTSIGQLAFSHCRNLKSITFEASDTTLNLGSSAFQFTAVTEDTFVTNNRNYSNKETAFANTALVEEEPVTTQKPEDIKEPEPSETPEIESEQKKILKVSSANGIITVSVDDKPIVFSDALPFIDENERTQIPIRAAAEALDSDVEWDESKQTVTITKRDTKITIVIGSDQMKINDSVITMDTEARIVNERTYIPIRFAGEALGMEVEWYSL